MRFLLSFGISHQGVAHFVEHVTFLGSKKRESLLGTGARYVVTLLILPSVCVWLPFLLLLSNGGYIGPVPINQMPDKMRPHLQGQCIHGLPSYRFPCPCSDCQQSHWKQDASPSFGCSGGDCIQTRVPQHAH